MTSATFAGIRIPAHEPLLPWVPREYSCPPPREPLYTPGLREHLCAPGVPAPQPAACADRLTRAGNTPEQTYTPDWGTPRPPLGFTRRTEGGGRGSRGTRGPRARAAGRRQEQRSGQGAEPTKCGGKGPGRVALRASTASDVSHQHLHMFTDTPRREENF